MRKTPSLVCVVVMMATSLIIPSAASAETPTCFGKSATIVVAEEERETFGTEGADVIVGTTGPDAIYGMGGKDYICGRRGPDKIVTGNADPDVADPGVHISGGRGWDEFASGDGNDIIYGGRGVDGEIVTGGGDDTVRLGRGDDNLESAAAGDDIIYGGPGDDTVDQAGLGADRIYGGVGDDHRLYAADGISGNDLVDGKAGIDGCAADRRDTVRNCEHGISS